MKVAINTQTAIGNKSGFGSYVSNLVRYVPQVSDVEYVSIENTEYAKDLNTPQRLFWDQIGFLQKMSQHKGIDLIHQPSFSAPVFTTTKTVVTIHDIIPVIFPENLAPASRFFFSKIMPFSYRFADHYLTDSHHSKNDIIERLHIPAEKITVTHLAASEEYRVLETKADKERIEGIKKKYNIPEDYFLHIGTIEPRKNISMLVEAFYESIVKNKLPYCLVIVGKKGWWHENLFARVQELGLENKVIFTGYTDLEEMPYLCSGATAFTFPSLYEGFGLPPLEAMAHGTPVLASNTSSLPEVVGNAAMLVNPENVFEIMHALHRVLVDQPLREKMKQRGYEQVKKFSWEIAARQILVIYKEIASGLHFKPLVQDEKTAGVGVGKFR